MLARKGANELSSFSLLTTAVGWVLECAYSLLGPCHHPGETDGARLCSIRVGLEEQGEGRTSSRAGAFSATGSFETQTRNVWG